MSSRRVNQPGKRKVQFPFIRKPLKDFGNTRLDLRGYSRQDPEVKLITGGNALLPMITDRPRKLELDYAATFRAPRQYVWLLKPKVMMPSDCVQLAEESPAHSRIVTAITFRHLAFHLDPLPEGWDPKLNHAPLLYEHWDLPSDPTSQKFWKLWRELNLDKETKAALSSFTKPEPELQLQFRRVYVEAHNGGPWGFFIHELLLRPHRGWALFVQTYGIPNGVPCEECCSTYRRSTIADLAGEGYPPTHVMWPFFGCVSIPGFKEGKCGNCAWGMRTCSWTKVDELWPCFHLKAGQYTNTNLSLDVLPLGNPINVDRERSIRRQISKYKEGKRRVRLAGYAHR
ncbi:hypothetical protein QBC43DRAFT_294656 [Cladorrhinum sp. PSN259]|nr:hypothetical protein QBC43DRAFT_294656 [Cladorrhinum sp. PSN259]